MTAMPLDRAAVEARLGDLPSMPAVVTALLASFGSESANLTDLAQRIAADQPVAARMLRVANSPFYGLQSQVPSVREAIVVLGFRTVRSLIIAAGMTRVLGQLAPAAGHLDNLWRHNLAVALCSESLARQFGEPADVAFTAGLMHDLGQLVFATSFPEHQARIGAEQKSRDCFLFEAERAVTGMDHAVLGAILAERWRFPAAIREAVAIHHCPDQPGATPLAGLVHVADALVHACGITGLGQELVPTVSDAAWKRLGLSDALVAKALGQTERELGHICAALLG